MDVITITISILCRYESWAALGSACVAGGAPQLMSGHYGRALAFLGRGRRPRRRQLIGTPPLQRSPAMTKRCRQRTNYDPTPTRAFNTEQSLPRSYKSFWALISHVEFLPRRGTQ
ncbi:hypothetical protein EVAR_20842_1 [Eumeta japonica]|uniref:Uncharacterized protein n=1 Tax=Eumeta variegata TaxID=151549 RepID=A0A4C1UDR5_EUMVA|nr:hypothetical protein EVAR_20842_1 [Eumeta japonica]